MTAVVQHVHFKMRSLQAWFLALFDPLTDLPHMLLRVAPELASQFAWWCSTQNLMMGRPFQQPCPQIQVTTDASLTSCGAHCRSLQIHAQWSQREKLFHIIGLKLLTLMKACRAFKNHLVGKMVQIVTDNTTMMYYILKQGDAHSPSLFYLAVDLWEWCLSHHIV